MNPNTRYLSVIPTIEFHYQAQLEDEGWQAFNLIVLHLQRDILSLNGGRCCCCHMCFFNYTKTFPKKPARQKWTGPIYLPGHIHKLLSQEAKDASQKYNVEAIQKFKTSRPQEI